MRKKSNLKRILMHVKEIYSKIMATISYIIGNKNKDGLRRVSFVLCHKKERRRILSDILLNPNEVTPKGRIKSVEKDMMIQKLLCAYRTRLATISVEIEGRDVSAAYLEEAILSKVDDIELFKFFELWKQNNEIKGMVNYETALNSIARFIGRRELWLKSITYDWLEKYSASLKDKPRARSLYLGALRHLYKEAQRRYNNQARQVLPYSPFDSFRVPKQKMVGKRSLTLEQLLEICNFQSKEWRVTIARDCFKLSFCLMGINSADMFSAPPIKDGKICYQREKTKDRRADNAYIEVLIHPCIKELIRRYKDNKRALLFHNRYKHREDFNRALNLGLKKIGKALGIDGLQFYQARHTFATLLRNLVGASRSDVDEALNHKDRLLADIYIKKDFKRINELNFRLLDEVFGNPEESNKNVIATQNDVPLIIENINLFDYCNIV